jgi:hypothetical protein
MKQKSIGGIWIWRGVRAGRRSREGKDNSKVTLGCKVVLEVALLYSLKVLVTVRTRQEL